MVSVLLLASVACDGRSSPAAPGDANAASEPGATAADPPTQTICEHARDRVVELTEIDGQLAEQDAPADQRATARERGEALTQSVRQAFVSVCLSLDSEDLRCMAKIDHYADAALAAKRGDHDCGVTAAGGCEQWSAAAHEAEASFGGCHEVVEEVVGRAMALTRPKPKNWQVVGTMVRNNEVRDEDERSVGTFEAGDEGGKADVRLGAATVDGPLDHDFVRRIVRAHAGELSACYSAGLSKNPALAGAVTIEFTINAEGRVSTSAPVDPDTFGDPGVPNCMAKAMKKWRFPEPLGGGEVRVSFPFTLE
ncbi:putative abductin-like protein [Enhygromyxa salina]|uniref:Putative abductin-like protein n=1 Tax=Enhygromyxa salina TaxID=215803 RepID=A0A0C1Z4Q1_9BACT|nr:putative abductin-like protein [Enhygromyxa salina]